MGILLEPPGQFHRILRMPFGAQRQRLQSLQQLERRKRIQGRAEIPQDLNAHPNGKGDGTKGVPEAQTVIAGAGFDELRKAFGVLAPVEPSRVDDDTGDGGAMAADPFRGGVRDDIGTMIDGAHKVAPGAECVIDLGDQS